MGIVSTIEGGDFGLMMPLEFNQLKLNLAVCDVPGHGIGSSPIGSTARLPGT
jgi:hypothetical protein